MTWSRAAHLGLLAGADRFDTLVVGGGIIGAGVALDLAARGLQVALVEQHDFAAGTSSRSTKLLHGGIRYLPQLEFHLVAEGLREQEVLAGIADWLFRPLRFVIPLYRQYGIADAPGWATQGRRASTALRAGLMIYDLLGGRDRPGAHHRRLEVEEVVRLIPRLRREGLRSGYVYSDAQTDDARLVLAVLRTAVDRYGATAVNRIRATRLKEDGAGYTVGVVDTTSGDEWNLRARTVVAATGAFPVPPLDGARGLPIMVSKGAHLIVSQEALGLLDHAVVLPETEDGRVLFISPWQGHALVGTTDTPYREDLLHPAPAPEDVAYLVRHVTKFLAVPDFEPLSSFAGLRALAATRSGTTASAPRDHVIAQPRPGYIQVAGGKLTTYRRISAQAAARVTRHLGLRGRSPTAEILLVGAGGKEAAVSTRLGAAGIAAEAAAAAVGRYGSAAEGIADLTRDNPHLNVTHSDGTTTLAEVVHAVRHESAYAVPDFTLRRTRLAWLTPDHGRKDQRAIASTMATELGWDSAETAPQIEVHEQELLAEGL
jgi:glycerol-3-phosphate dehydrogenase